MDQIIRPKSLGISNEKIWIVGNDKKDKLVIELYGNQELIAKKALGKNIFVSDMKVSEERVFIIGRSLGSRKQLENFFLRVLNGMGEKLSNPGRLGQKIVEVEERLEPVYYLYRMVVY